MNVRIVLGRFQQHFLLYSGVLGDLLVIRCKNDQETLFILSDEGVIGQGITTPCPKFVMKADKPCI